MLRRLRQVMADGGDRQERLDKIVQLIAASMNTAVCSVYLRRGRDGLELCATEGLNPDAVHQTVLHLAKVWSAILRNISVRLIWPMRRRIRALPIARNRRRPVFELCRCAGFARRRRDRRAGGAEYQKAQFCRQEVEALQTVAMVLAEMLSASGEETADDEADPDARACLRGAV